MTEHWLVLGASSSIARAFAREVSRRGAAVTLVGRDAADLDATAGDCPASRRRQRAGPAVRCHRRALRAAFLPQAALADTLLNVFLAIGSMPDQAAMDATRRCSRDGRCQLQRSGGPVAGPGGRARSAARRKRRRRRLGRRRPRPRKNYLYGSAKAALARYAEGLRARLHPCGATVTVVKPGFVDTAMTWGLPGLFLVATPEACARAILRAADKGSPRCTCRSSGAGSCSSSSTSRPG
jgi:NAD(P)-dependent dehydrogenase (short-subunit alcohol dehydrogenase family)